MKPISAALFVLSALLLLSVSSAGGGQLQVIGKGSMYIFGVSTENGTVVGVPAVLNLTVTNGTGQVFLGSSPLTQTDTQAQAEISTDTACQLLSISCSKYNFYYFITASTPEIGGPSAGGAFAVLAMSILSGKPLSPHVAMTGTANPDGSIGIVGDVSEKSMAAANQGIGVFLYPSTDNVSRQAESYDQMRGLVLVPVSTVDEAFQYFTGYNVSAPLNYNFTTPLFNSLMRSTYLDFNAYQMGILSTVQAFPSKSGLVSSLITTANATIANENALAASGNYYVAASEMVNASGLELVEASVLEQLSQASNTTSSLLNLILQENASIKQTYSNITSNYVTNSSTLDLKLIAIDRLAQASALLNASMFYLTRNSSLAIYGVKDYIYYYALSEVKRVSSEYWLSIVPKGASNFTEASLASQSLYYLNKAYSYSSYASLLGANLAAYQYYLENYLNKSQAYYNSGKYVPSLFDSLSAIATAQLLIEGNSLLNSSFSGISPQVFNSALSLLNAAQNSGATPFLGISYYQYAKSFENNSAACLLTPSECYVFYASLSRTYSTFERDLANASLPSALVIPQPINVSSPLYNEVSILYLALGLAIGVLVAGSLYEYKLRSLVKKKRVVLRKTRKRGRKRRSR
jgi:predicted S18 family serine protease